MAGRPARLKNGHFVPILLFLFLAALPLPGGCAGNSAATKSDGESGEVAEALGGRAYPTGFSLVEVPDPLSGCNPRSPEPDSSLPEAGAAFGDGCFSTLLTRVTEADGINGRREYSRFDPFDADASMVLLVRGDGDHAVYRTGSCPYNRPGNLVGLTVADRGLSGFHRIDYTTAHADVGLDMGGNEVVVMQDCWTD